MTRKRAGSLLCLALLVWPTVVASQPAEPLQDEPAQDWPTPRQLDAALRFGALATTGPLCGLRDPAWGTDLWRAELLASGAPSGLADPARQRLTDRVGAALSYAEDEALESFAERPADQTCRPLADDPDLARADQMVAAFRAGQPLW